MRYVNKTRVGFASTARRLNFKHFPGGNRGHACHITNEFSAVSLTDSIQHWLYAFQQIEDAARACGAPTTER